MSACSSQRGAGLIELLIAVAIIGTGLVAAISALSTGSLAVRSAAHDAVAQSLVQANLEEVKAAPYAETYEAISETGYDVFIDVDTAAENLQKITVTVLREGTTLLAVEDYKVNR